MKIIQKWIWQHKGIRFERFGGWCNFFFDLWVSGVEIGGSDPADAGYLWPMLQGANISSTTLLKGYGSVC